MKSLEGQRILFIAPRFFGYEREIADAMRARGARVDWLADRPYDSPIMTATTRFVPRAVLPFADRLYQSRIEALAPPRYDHILVLNGQTVSRTFLRRLRRDFPTASLTLYMWDSVENRGRVVENFSLFDRISSFDPSTVDRYGAQLRPLFYTRTSTPLSPGAGQFDASFVGTAHSDRYAVISRLRGNLDPQLRTFWFLYLQARWLFRVYQTTSPGMRRAKPDEFSFAPLGKDRLKDVFEQSIAIVDVEHPRQRGLTMRTFETMGLNRKLITTNAQVKGYDFYDPDNILVIDRNDPTVDIDFFRRPYRSLPDDVFKRYSIDGWIDEILDLSENGKASVMAAPV